MTHSALSSNDILTYLKDNPDFLQRHPEATDFLTFPKRGTGKDGRKIVDFQSFMIERLKGDKEKVLQTTQKIVENVRSNMNNQQRIYESVLRLLEATSFDALIQMITMDIASMLDTDIAVLLIETNDQAIPDISVQGIRILPEGTIDHWLQGQDILLQANISGLEAIYGGGANLVQSQALLKLSMTQDTPPALIAFGSRNPTMFEEGQATDQISFLARVIERCFMREMRYG